MSAGDLIGGCAAANVVDARGLEGNQFAYRCKPNPEGHFEVVIWHKSPVTQ